jgi:hypothetical protein
MTSLADRIANASPVASAAQWDNPPIEGYGNGKPRISRNTQQNVPDAAAEKTTSTPQHITPSPPVVNPHASQQTPIAAVRGITLFTFQATDAHRAYVEQCPDDVFSTRCTRSDRSFTDSHAITAQSPRHHCSISTPSTASTYFASRGREISVDD